MRIFTTESTLISVCASVLEPFFSIPIFIPLFHSFPLSAVIPFCISHNSLLNVTFSFQAEFSEINLVATSVGTYSVTVDAIRNGHKVNK